MVPILRMESWQGYVNFGRRVCCLGVAMGRQLTTAGGTPCFFWFRLRRPGHIQHFVHAVPTFLSLACRPGIS